MSDTVFSTGSANETINDQTKGKCGANFCPAVASGNSSGNNIDTEKPTTEQIYLLAGILLGFALLASVIIALLVDPLTKYTRKLQLKNYQLTIYNSRFGELQREGSAKGLTGVKLLLATFKQMLNPYQILIIPLTMWSGFEQAFLTADFTAVRQFFRTT